MVRVRVVTFLLLAGAIAAATFFTLREWAGAGVAAVKDVPPGHQEIAWISPATSTDAWERLVAALELLREDKSGALGAAGKTLRVDLDNAFLPLSADVPEVALYFDDAPDAKLWIRWYKLSGENPSRKWIDKLAQRGRPPLALIGGETSDRALYQTRNLQAARSHWSGPPPLYFITTATAERYDPRDYPSGEVSHDHWPKLMDVYPERTYRFCFTNTRMVEAVLDFVHRHPQVCAQRLSDPQVAAALVGQAGGLTSLNVLRAAGHLQPYFLSTLRWSDDGYSTDLAEIFLQTYSKRYSNRSDGSAPFFEYGIHYSIGDFLQPNPRESLAVGVFLTDNASFRDQPQLLALPTGTQRARRFLRTLCRRAPLEVRNVIVVTGDAISFNNIYRDRDVAWNIQDMPVPLVFFSHRDPIDAGAGFGRKGEGGARSSTGTHEVLLNRDMIEALVLAVFDQGRLAADADALKERLSHTRWHQGRVGNDLVIGAAEQGQPFFDVAGNRRPGTGEHIIWLRPVFEGQRNRPEAYISVWSAMPASAGPADQWLRVGEPLHVRYDMPSLEDSDAHDPG